MDEENAIKIILIGESGVGKTNLINVFFGKEFNINTVSTSTSYFFEGKYRYNNNNYFYNIWDTAGQEQYRSLNKLFIKDAKIVLCVYSINSAESFDQMEFWINYVKDILAEGSYILGIVANKSDLYLEQNVTEEQGRNLAEKHNCDFVITSALTNVEGFKEFVNELIEKCINNLLGIGTKDPNNRGFNINKKGQNTTQKKKICCK